MHKSLGGCEVRKLERLLCRRCSMLEEAPATGASGCLLGAGTDKGLDAPFVPASLFAPNTLRLVFLERGHLRKTDVNRSHEPGGATPLCCRSRLSRESCQRRRTVRRLRRTFEVRSSVESNRWLRGRLTLSPTVRSVGAEVTRLGSWRGGTSEKWTRIELKESFGKNVVLARRLSRLPGSSCRRLRS